MLSRDCEYLAYADSFTYELILKARVRKIRVMQGVGVTLIVKAISSSKLMQVMKKI